MPRNNGNDRRAGGYDRGQDNKRGRQNYQGYNDRNQRRREDDALFAAGMDEGRYHNRDRRWNQRPTNNAPNYDGHHLDLPPRERAQERQDRPNSREPYFENHEYGPRRY